MPKRWLFAAAMGAGGFNVIVGNPPYIRIQNMVSYSREEIAFYQNENSPYTTARQDNFDKYALFSHVVRKTFLQTLREHLPADAAYSPENVQALVRAVCHYFVYLNSQCPPSDRQLRPVAETEVQAVVCETLGRLLQERPEVENAELTATYLSWAIFGAGLEWIGNRSEQAVGETATAICVLVEKTLQSLTR